MKIKLENPFQTLALLMAVLIFSAPFVICAQQNVVSAKTANGTGSDGNTVILEAKAAAEQDASRDVNKLVWFGAGVAVPTVGLAGALAGCLVGSIINPQTDDFFGIPGTNTEMEVGMVVGFVVGVLAPLIWIGAYKPNLPPEAVYWEIA